MSRRTSSRAPRKCPRRRPRCSNSRPASGGRTAPRARRPRRLPAGDAALMRPPVVAIIGAGQGGFQTAASLREAGFDGAVVLIGEEAGLPYERPPLSKSYLAGTLPPERLWLRPQAFYDKERIAYLAGETVAAIDRPGRRLRLASGR